MQPTLTASVNRARASGEFVLGEWPEEKWWEVLDSGNLNHLIEKALVDNPSIGAIKARMDLAKAESIVTRSQLYPLVFFEGENTAAIQSKNGLYRELNQSIPRFGNLIDLSLGFTYEFDFWQQYANSYKASLSRYQYEKANTKQVELIVSTSVAQVFYALKTNLKREKLYKQLVRIQKKAYQLENLLYRKALYSRIPLTFAKEKLYSYQQALIEIQEEIAVNKHMVNILTGVGPDEVLDIDDVLEDPEKKLEIPKTINIELLCRRPDLMAAIWKAEGFSYEVEVAIADFYPNINLKSLVGLETFNIKNLFSSASTDASIVPSFFLPIYTAGAIAANVRAKKAEFTQAVYEYNDLLLKSTKEVADVLVFLDSIYERRNRQQRIIDQADFRLGLISLNYRSGLANLLDVYRNEEEKINTELEDIELIYGRYVGSIKLIKALGGGYYSECREL